MEFLSQIRERKSRIVIRVGQTKLTSENDAVVLQKGLFVRKYGGTFSVWEFFV